ncbi:MAG: hypothetical protein ABFD98_18770 [Syntrophobacteraceae bacterium]|nr:hypothetical protein [Desulfobacteraceae bacterium]
MNRWLLRLFVASFFIFALCACSGGGGPDEAGEGGKNKTTSEQAAEAVKDYGAKPIGKARAAQQVGQERTDAIDNALRQN